MATPMWPIDNNSWNSKWMMVAVIKNHQNVYFGHQQLQGLLMYVHEKLWNLVVIWNLSWELFIAIFDTWISFIVWFIGIAFPRVGFLLMIFLWVRFQSLLVLKEWTVYLNFLWNWQTGSNGIKFLFDSVSFNLLCFIFFWQFDCLVFQFSLIWKWTNWLYILWRGFNWSGPY